MHKFCIIKNVASKLILIHKKINWFESKLSKHNYNWSGFEQRVLSEQEWAHLKRNQDKSFAF